MSKTFTLALHPVVGALKQCEDILKIGEKWQACNPAQEHLIRLALNITGRSELKLIPDMDCIGTSNPLQLETWFAEHGFPGMKFEEAPPGGILAGAVLDVSEMWIPTADRIEELKCEDGFTYPGIHIGHSVEIVETSNHPHPIAMVEGVNFAIMNPGDSLHEGDKVCLTPLHDPPTGLELVDYARILIRTIETGQVTATNMAQVTCPMINCEHEPDMTWIEGLSSEEDATRYICKAIQKNRFRLNEYGCRAQSAMGVLVAGIAEGDTYVINHPFLLWIMRPGVSLPLFVGYFDYDVFADPGTLE